MQLKYKRDFTLIEMLEKTLELIPLERRLGLGIEFSTSEYILSQNLEAIYTIATQRLLHLSYYLEWARTIEGNKELKPEPFRSKNLDYFPATFHDFEKMPIEHSNFYNSSFAGWINILTVRDLNEFLKVYLGELYETCTVLDRVRDPIKPEDIVDLKNGRKVFDKAGMKERLGILRKEFAFCLTHHREILSLYEMRNVLSHFDGVVEKKFCNKDGYLEVSWPQNVCKFKKRGKNEWVPYHKVQKPFSSDVYESLQIDWMSKPEIRRYKVKDEIRLSYKDLNDLISFYLNVFNELHKRLVDIAKNQGFKVRPFEKYGIVFGGLHLISFEEE